MSPAKGPPGPASAVGSPAAPASEAGMWDIPAPFLRRILSLSTSLGPDSGLDSFTARLAGLACELGDFAYAVIFLFDAVDDAFYAEAMQGIDGEDWQEILAMPVPRRVHERLMATADRPGAPFVVRPTSTAFTDPEVAGCLLPLLRPSAGAALDAAATHATRARADQTLVLVPLEAKGRRVVGFCAGVRAGMAPRSVQLRALAALAGQGALFIENIHLYRAQLEEAAVSSALLRVAGALGTTDVDVLVEG
ncbi:MAG: hypothetical protein ACRDIE_12365, partial [Chloroflexota bacterium]